MILVGIVPDILAAITTVFTLSILVSSLQTPAHVVALPIVAGLYAPTAVAIAVNLAAAENPEDAGVPSTARQIFAAAPTSVTEPPTASGQAHEPLFMDLGISLPSDAMPGSISASALPTSTVSGPVTDHDRGGNEGLPTSTTPLSGTTSATSLPLLSSHKGANMGKTIGFAVIVIVFMACFVFVLYHTKAPCAPRVRQSSTRRNAATGRSTTLQLRTLSSSRPGVTRRRSSAAEGLPEYSAGATPRRSTPPPPYTPSTNSMLDVGALSAEPSQIEFPSVSRDEQTPRSASLPVGASITAFIAGRFSRRLSLSGGPAMPTSSTRSTLRRTHMF